jgi:hypothetical protein
MHGFLLIIMMSAPSMSMPLEIRQIGPFENAASCENALSAIRRALPSVPAQTKMLCVPVDATPGG